MRSRLLSLLLILTMLPAFPTQGLAKEKPLSTDTEPSRSAAEGRCLTPREALYTLLYWQESERFDRHKAAACLDRRGLDNPEEQSAEEAVSLKHYLDAHGIKITWSEIPGDPQYRDNNNELRFLLPLSGPDALELTRVQGRWLVSRDSLEHLATTSLGKAIALGSGIRDWMPEWLRGRFFGIEAWKLLSLFVLVFIGLVIRSIAMHLILFWAKRLTRRYGLHWLDDAARKSERPIGLLFIAGTLAIGVPFLLLPSQLTTISWIAIRSIAAYGLVWLCYRFVDIFADILAERAAKTPTKLDDQLVPLIRKSLKVLFVAVGFVFILQNLDVDVGSLLAGLGIGGLAVALAAKDTLANLFGSAMIFIDKPFQIGDWISIGSDIEGTVEEVGFRTTRLRTLYYSVITIPNANLTNAAIDNYSARPARRYRTFLHLDLDTPPEKVEAFCDALRAVILATPKIGHGDFTVEFHAITRDAIEVMVWAFFNVPTWAEEQRHRSYFNLSILRIAAELNVTFARPNRVLHLASTPEAPFTPAPTPSVESLREIGARFGPEGDQARPDGLGFSGTYERIAPNPRRDSHRPMAKRRQN